MSQTKLFVPILLSILLMSRNMQRSMLYYPDYRLPSGSELTAKGLQFWPDGPAGYRGYISTCPIKAVKGTVIILHGNAGTADDRDYYVSPLCLMGYRIILAEYPGYGEREGELSEQSFVQDSLETVRIAAAKQEGPIYLLGESLGCGVVAGAARNTSVKIPGLLLITPWDTLLAVAKHHYPSLPVGWFMKDKYDNAKNLASFQGKIAVVGAARDEVIPIRHARQLFAQLPENKRMWIIDGVGHNDWIMRMDMSKWEEIMDFVSKDGS